MRGAPTVGSNQGAPGPVGLIGNSENFHKGGSDSPNLLISKHGPVGALVNSCISGGTLRERGGGFLREE